MGTLALVLAAALIPNATLPCAKEAKLSALVVEVRSADYRGDRAALARLDEMLGGLDDERLSEYRDYWRGFARWRRAQNGFNETPTPADLVSDLELAVGHFKAALARRPDWVEANLALVGCWGNLVYLAGGDAEKKKAILGELVPAYQWLLGNGQENPRALWIIGGMQFAAPPPVGGDFAKAAATLRRGVALSWPAAVNPPEAPAWAPSWGGPENLMNLAYMYAHSGTPDRTAALAYAEGAITAVPEWHYVRDILLPQIEALPVAVAGR